MSEVIGEPGEPKNRKFKVTLFGISIVAVLAIVNKVLAVGDSVTLAQIMTIGAIAGGFFHYNVKDSKNEPPPK